MNLAVIIPAAGASTRYARAAAAEQGVEIARSKLDEDLGGRPVLHRTIELFANLAVEGVDVCAIIVPGPADPAAMAAFKARHGDKLGLLGCRVCPGGVTHRYETVRNAIALVPPAATHVAIHDAARPCASPELIERVLRAAERHPAVVPGLPVADTIKRVAPDPIADDAPDPLAAILGADASKRGPSLRAVEATLDRTHLVAAQTPQVFAAELIRRAYAQTNLDSTDDAQLVERLGQRVVVVPGEARNLKLTVPSDLALARAVLGLRGPESRPAHLKF
ncbi:MAG: 2-C-methyl-D-erythritol 4-phosphate cytidylyltransferase [Phycisphaerae bacterium]|nr:2-C-methyl-D-erythritol 4-phosphate cytidylyltransferase [Phycisphaerae bacterium]